MDLKLADIEVEGKWDLSKLSFNLPQFILDGSHPDFPFSPFAIDNQFSLKEAYKSIMEDHHHIVDVKWIWKAKVVPKLKFFLWLLWWELLPLKVPSS